MNSEYTHDTVTHGATTHTLPHNETKRNATTPKIVQADNRLHNLQVVEVTLELFFKTSESFTCDLQSSLDSCLAPRWRIRRGNHPAESPFPLTHEVIPLALAQHHRAQLSLA